jgi:pimeloyl-ACP methyl ester carboxylesterase
MTKLRRARSRSAHLAAAGLAIAGGAIGWKVLRAHDAEALAADPERHELERPAAGSPFTVLAPDGTELHAEVAGPPDAATVVLVHGWMCTSAVWRLQVRALSPHLRVVTYDQRGHGQSAAASDADHSSDALAADLAAVLDQAVPAGTRVVVAGHSMGAMAVVAFAHAHRHEVDHRLAGVALVNVGVEDLILRSTIIPFPLALAALRHAIGERVLGSRPPLPSSTNPVLSRLVRAIALAPAASPAQVALCTEMLLDCRTAARAGFGTTLSTIQLAHGLPALTVPTIVIAGQHDRLTPPVHARAIAAALPNATLVELVGTGHMAPIEAHGEISRHIHQLAATVLSEDVSAPEDYLLGR